MGVGCADSHNTISYLGNNISNSKFDWSVGMRKELIVNYFLPLLCDADKRLVDTIAKKYSKLITISDVIISDVIKG
jgi:hypothetical protein